MSVAVTVTFLVDVPPEGNHTTAENVVQAQLPLGARHRDGHIITARIDSVLWRDERARHHVTYHPDGTLTSSSSRLSHSRVTDAQRGA